MGPGRKQPTTPKQKPDLRFEYLHFIEGRTCVGIDEVGRGCLAGPVVTAAVILPAWLVQAGPDPRKLSEVEPACEDGPWWLELNDSKLLTPKTREKLAALIQKHARVQVAWCSVEEIDRFNILRAAMFAMRRAAIPFFDEAQVALVDGNSSPFDPRYLCTQADPTDGKRRFAFCETIVKGDQRSMSIAAASIVAKVYRDRWMEEFDRLHPGYGFAENKGYSAPVHYDGLRRLGPCGIHRKTFAPVAAELQQGLSGLGQRAVQD